MITREQDSAALRRQVALMGFESPPARAEATMTEDDTTIASIELWDGATISDGSKIANALRDAGYDVDEEIRPNEERSDIYVERREEE